MARPACAEERLRRGADALRAWQPLGGEQHSAATSGYFITSAAHRSTHASRACSARSSTPQDEGEFTFYY